MKYLKKALAILIITTSFSLGMLSGYTAADVLTQTTVVSQADVASR